jgi:predicted transcriptional regulator
MSRRKWFIGTSAALFPGLFVLFFWWRSLGEGEDVLSRARSESDAASTHASTGEPLFPFADLYLDGRSSWMRERFALDRRRIAELEPPEAAVMTCRVHRQPFTGGPWVDELDEDLARQRQEIEEQAVEAEVTFFVEGVEPERLAAFIAFSGFQAHIAGEGQIENEYYLPPLERLPPGLEKEPPFAPGRYLGHQRWRRPLAWPTALYYLNRLAALDGGWSLIYEAWKNSGDKSHVPIRLAAGQYFLSPRGKGSLVHLHSFYSGQKIPLFSEGLVERLTTGFYDKLAKVIRERSRSWEPPEALRDWLRRQPLK